MRFAVPLVAVALLAAACNGDDGNGDGEPDAPDVAEGTDITVGSFNFPESEILAEAYAQALEDAGYPVARQLNLGSRELIFPELEGGSIDLLPEYLGSAIVEGFGEQPPTDVEDGLTQLGGLFGDLGITVLEAAPAQNANTFVTTAALADQHGLAEVGDLDAVGSLVFAGPPECEERATCYRGLVDTYGLEEVTFTSIQEPAARLAALDAGDAEMILLFSTDAPLAGDELVALEDPQQIVPPENIVPVVRSEILEVHGDDLQDVLDGVTAALTTEALQQMNADASEGRSPAAIAGDWLEDNGLTG